MSGGGGSGGTQESAEARALYRTQAKVARSQWGEYEKYGSPILADLAGEAMEGASSARYAERIGAAGADVTQAFATERDSMAREMGRYGVNPSSGRYVGTQRRMGLAEAGSKAGAMTRERRAVDDETYSRNLNVLGLATGQGAQAQQGLASAAGGMQGIANTKAQAKASHQQGVGQLVGTAATTAAIF